MTTSAEKTLLTTSRFRVVEVEQPLPGGTVRNRQVVRHPGAVTVLPLLDDGRVCLIRNFRVAVGRTLIELPAGTLEPGEPPAETASRELVEETGYRAREIEHLHSFYLSPGILDERMHLFAARHLEWVGAAREPGEEIENLLVSWEEALAMVVRGEIEDAKSLTGLLYYQQRYGTCHRS